MLGLGKHGPDGKYAVIVDIGSGSVGIAIVASDIVTEEYPIIYSDRIPATLGKTTTTLLIKKIEEALFQAFLKLGSDGLKSLASYDRNGRISYLQVTISAPWTHTVSQQAIYEEEVEFKITHSLINQLVASARKKVTTILADNPNLQKEDLQIFSQATLYISANGYNIESPIGLSAQKLYISHAIGLAQKHLLVTLREMRDKVLPNIAIQGHTFMLVYYKIIRHIFPNQSEFCLIDITHEATEIGIVRNYELKKTLHVTIGSQTLLRTIEDKTGIPAKNSTLFLEEHSIEISDAHKLLLESIFAEYGSELSTHFKAAGDILTIPKNIYIHSDIATEKFFLSHVQNAAEKATGGTHLTQSITAHLSKFRKVHDSALFLSAYYFHTLHKQSDLANYK
jgi:hypothetical protein